MSLGGAYSFALADYYMANTTLFLDTLASFDLAQLIDPYAYMEYYRNKPIMIILAASDEFMLPENTKFFWKEISVQANDKAYLRFALLMFIYFFCWWLFYIFSLISKTIIQHQSPIDRSRRKNVLEYKKFHVFAYNA